MTMMIAMAVRGKRMRVGLMKTKRKRKRKRKENESRREKGGRNMDQIKEGEKNLPH